MKIVVAYSGRVDTSVLLNWLKDTYSAEVIAFCADIGQEEELDGLEAKAPENRARANVLWMTCARSSPATSSFP